MKKVYYVCHCGSGQSVHCTLLELHKQIGNKMLFHVDGWDYNKCKSVRRTLKAYIKTRLNCNGERVEYIDFHSSLDDYKYSFIKMLEIEEGVEPKKSLIYN